MVGRRASASSRFNRLWAGETVSFVGTSITQLALPVLVVEQLNASPLQLGVLNACAWLPFLLFTVPFGVVADTVPRRPLMLLSEFGRVLVLGAIPALMWLNLLSFPAVLVVTIASGALGVLFEVCFFAFIPSLLPHAELIRANSRLYGSQSFAMVAGPASGAFLVQAVGASAAVGVDALSYLASGAAVFSVKLPEERHPWSCARVVVTLRDGARVTFGVSEIRVIVRQAATYNLFYYMALTALFPYLLNDVAVSSGTVGKIFAISGAASVLGATLAPRIARSAGFGRTILLTALLVPFAAVLLPVSTLLGAHRAVVVTVGWTVIWVGVSANNVLATTLRQTLCPPGALASANAVYRTVVWGVNPVGALAGGVLADRFGFGWALAAAVAVLAFVPVWIATSSIPGLRELPVRSEPAPVDRRAAASTEEE
jgi:MFS family permease